MIRMRWCNVIILLLLLAGSRSNSPPRNTKISSITKTPTRKVTAPSIDVTKPKAVRPPSQPKAKEQLKTTSENLLSCFFKHSHKISLFTLIITFTYRS